jgi:hypothetical protein
MVFYKCDKCYKEYTKKHNYESHLKRKNPCIQEEEINIIKNLEKEINIIKDNNITLKQEIKVLEEEKNIILKQKQKLLKNVQGYIYIIRERDFVQLNEEIYKIGRISTYKKLEKYKIGTEIIGCFKVNDSVECENKIIKCFSNHTNITKMKEYGKEYFQGNKNELLYEMLQIVKNDNN